MIDSERRTFANLMLSLLLRTDTVAPLTLRGMEGAHTLIFARQDGDDVRVDLDPATNLPKQLRFDVRARLISGALTGQTVSVRIEMSDFKPAGNLTLAHKITTYRRGALEGVRELQSIEVNPLLTAADFLK